jgi:hypothetical protein
MPLGTVICSTIFLLTGALGLATLPRKGALLSTFLPSARWRTAGPVSFVGYPAAPHEWTRPAIFAPLVRVALDQPERPP